MQIDLTPDEINLLIAGLLASHYEGEDEDECCALIKRLDALLGQGPAAAWGYMRAARMRF
jgi:hypothetical protein